MLGHVLVMVIALCWGTVAAPPPPGPNEDSLNHYIDMVMDNVQTLIVENHLDPATLPDISTNFSKEILFVTWHGEAVMYDGWLRGLANIYRSGNAEFIRDDQNIVIGLSSGLGIGSMDGFYKYIAKFMDLGPKGDIDITVNGAEISFSAALDREVCRFHVSKLKVDKIGHIGVKVHGLGLLDWILDLLVDVISNVVKIFIHDTIEDTMSTIVNIALDTVDLSVIGSLIGCEPQPAPGQLGMGYPHE